MIFIPQNADDISRYYRNTYVKFKETGDKLFHIREINNHVIRGQDEDNTEFELYLSEEFPYEVDYVIPNKSYFQFKNRACLLQRIPAKQYRRGLCHDNTQIITLTRTGSSGSMEVNFESLKAFVSKQTFPSFDKAVTSKGNKMISIALSPRFAYVPDVKHIFVDTVAVATVDHPQHKVIVHFPVFVPEIKALAKGSIFEVTTNA